MKLTVKVNRFSRPVWALILLAVAVASISTWRAVAQRDKESPVGSSARGV